ncbi:MAG: Beta-glucanase precursor [Firmicutes bacterium ADurb.Bin419]|nr:MAG: Beta-glucanase precursor [Firmicutes bacterium ADurb.Bin419]
MKKRCFFTVAVLLTILLGSFTCSHAATHGDLNGDGSANSIDFGLYKMYLLGGYQISDKTVADLNGDGSTNSIDFGIFKQYLLGIISSFPVNGMPTPVPTPTSVVDPDKAWESNTGTINLGSTITYTGEGIAVSGSTVYITSGGDHTVTGTLSNGMIKISTAERVKLRLNGVNITNSTGPAIYFENVDKGFITLVEGTSNTLTDGRSYMDTELKATLFSNDDLEIKGKGTLDIIGNFNHAIASDDDINIENGVINVISSVNDGIHSNGSIEVKGGTLNITATGDALQTEEEELIIEKGTLNLSAGSQALKSDTGIVINGGKINVIKAKEGAEAPIITINDGTVNINATDDCLNATMGTGSMFNDGSQLIINGGTVYASSTNGDSLDSNGTLTINGGTVVVHGPQSQPEVAIDSNSTFTISGGTLIATGPSAMMAQYPTGASSQYSIAAMFSSSQRANSALCVKDSTGKALIITKPTRNYLYAVFSSPELKKDSTYTIYSGGTVTGGTEANGLIIDGTYSGGTLLATITVTKSPTTAINWNGGGGFPGWGW